MHSFTLRIRQHRRHIILGLLLSAFMLAVGVFWYQHAAVVRNQAAEAPTTPAPQSVVPPSDATSATVVDEESAYIRIPEWQVRMKRVAGLERLISYHNNEAADMKAIFFSSAELVAADPNCSADSGQLGLLERSVTPLEDQAGARTADAFINGFYYYYSGPQALCLTSEGADTTQNEALVDSQQAAMAAAIKTLEAME